jgi:ABC-type molybdate transport system substrate-binding protein
VVAGTDSTTLLFKMAVASNFVTPVQTLANAYLSSLGTSATNYIEICGNSSGTISSEINSYNATDLFSLFMSADVANANVVRDGPYGRGGSFPYANGIPTFLLSPAATSADPGTYPALDYLTINSSPPPGAWAEGAAAPISDYVILNRNPSATYRVATLAIGNPTLAPYGAAAMTILNKMGFGTPTYANADTDVTSNCSSLVSSGQWICGYRNIDYTLQAIDNDRVTAGIVSYGQICPAFHGSAYDPKRYALFTQDPTHQNAISLVSTGTEQTNSDNFLTYLGVKTPNATNGFSSTWNIWLASNCYQTI